MSLEGVSVDCLEPPWLHVRGELFDFGLLPLPLVTLNGGVSSFRNLRTKLQEHCLPTPSCRTSFGDTQEKFGKPRAGSAGIAESLGVSNAHAHLILDTLASVLPDEGEADPLARVTVPSIESIGADVDDIVLFLYIQTFRKLPPRSYKDAAVVADVWPSPSVFDGFLSVSPTPQRCSRRSMAWQAEEEAHQLAFIRKHLPFLLALLAESHEGGDQDVKVVTLEKFQHLGLLLRATDVRAEFLPLSQATPFFANSDPNMPAAPVPVPQVLEWMLLHLCVLSERAIFKVENKGVSLDENDGPEVDVPMLDVFVSGNVSSISGPVANGLFHRRREWRPDGITSIEGVTSASVLKTEADVKNGSVKIFFCHDSVVYILGPMKFVSVYGCSDCVVVLGAVGKAVRVELCERVQIIAASARACIANCRECMFYLGVNQRPVVIGDNHNVQVAPYNTFYPKLEADLAHVGVDATINKWDSALSLGPIDLHDDTPYTPGAANVQADGASLLQPERFSNFVIPWCKEEELQPQKTRANPFPLPKSYLLAMELRVQEFAMSERKAVENLKKTLKEVVLEDNRKLDLTNAIHAHFKDWLYSTGNIRQIYDFQGVERDSKAVA